MKLSKPAVTLLAAAALLAGCSTQTDSTAAEPPGTTAPDSLASADSSATPTTSEAATSTEAPITTQAAESATLQLGDLAIIEGWELTITSVEANDEVEMYEATGPTKGYIITVEGTYLGGPDLPEEAQLANLGVRYVGADSRIYADYDAAISHTILPDQTPRLVVAGGTAVWQATLAFPVDAAGNSIVSIEPLGFSDPAEFEVGEL